MKGYQLHNPISVASRGNLDATIDHILQGIDPNLGLALFGSTGLVIASDAPAAMKYQAQKAKSVLGDLVQICDGVADDVQIQAVIDESGGGRVLLSKGDFNITSYIEPSLTGILSGQGKGTKIISSGNIPIFYKSDTVNQSSFIIEKMWLYGSGTGNAAIRGLDISVNGDYCHCRNLWIDNCYYGIYLNGDYGKSRYSDIVIGTGDECYVGLKTVGTSGLINGQHLNHILVGDSTSDGYQFDHADGLVGVQLVAINCGGHAYYFNGETATTQSNNQFHNLIADTCSGSGLKITEGSSTSCTRFQIYGFWCAACDYAVDWNGCSNSFITNPYITGMTKHCVYMTNGCIGNSISGGRIEGADEGDTDSYDLINLSGSSKQNIFEGIQLNQAEQGRYFWNEDTSWDNQLKNCFIEYGDGTSPIMGGNSMYSQIEGNKGYIHKGEVRRTGFNLTAGNANDICFSWELPELQDGFVLKIKIDVAVAGGTAGAVLEVGIADDASGTNRGTEFFDTLDLNTVGTYDSYEAGDGGTQTTWVFIDDSLSATDSFVVGQIKTQNAASLAGSAYIEYVGK